MCHQANDNPLLFRIQARYACLSLFRVFLYLSIERRPYHHPSSVKVRMSRTSGRLSLLLFQGWSLSLPHFTGAWLLIVSILTFLLFRLSFHFPFRSKSLQEFPAVHEIFHYVSLRKGTILSTQSLVLRNLIQIEGHFLGRHERPYSISFQTNSLKLFVSYEFLNFSIKYRLYHHLSHPR